MPPLEDWAGCHRESGLGDAAGRAGLITRIGTEEMVAEGFVGLVASILNDTRAPASAEVVTYVVPVALGIATEFLNHW